MHIMCSDQAHCDIIVTSPYSGLTCSIFRHFRGSLWMGVFWQHAVCE